MNVSVLPTVKDISVLRLSTMRDSRGDLTVLELSSTIPFSCARLFYVCAVPPHTTRGMHAHRMCNQFMICQTGRIGVTVDDGTDCRNFELLGNDAILVPPVIFASETFREKGSSLLVLCDRAYEPEDYLYSRDELLKYRNSLAAGAT
jgi:UDP-2-acetamido-3-amino-2,3-dideoxy-glucuronate N-acetyltransferase